MSRIEGQRNHEFYGASSEEYDEIVAAAGYSLPKITYDLIATRKMISGAMLLDVGIGTGLSSIDLAKSGAIVTGIDGSSEMLVECRNKKFADTLLLHDLTQGDFPNLGKKYDIIICLGLYEFVMRPRVFIRAIAAAMKPGGVLVLALRDRSLNPWLSVMNFRDLEIDERAYRDHGVIAVHHDYKMTRIELEECGIAITAEKIILAYHSPTQKTDTMNRIFIGKLIAPSESGV